MAIDVEQIERDLEALRASLDDVQSRKAAHEAALSELDDRRVETQARLALAEREAAAFAQRLTDLEAELEEARRHAAIEAFEAAATAKDERAEAIALAVDALLASLEALDVELHELAQMRKSLAERRVDVTIPPEPRVFIDAWQRLTALVRQTIQEDLEDELIEAAARSTRIRAIEELPVHLQEAARQRQRQRGRRGARARA